MTKNNTDPAGLSSSPQQYRVIADRDKGDDPQVSMIQDADRVTVVAYNAQDGSWEDGNEGIVRIERPVPTTDEPVVHFAPYGSTEASDGTPIPKPVGWDLMTGDYAPEEPFTVKRDRTTCPNCRSHFTTSPHPPTREQIAKVMQCADRTARWGENRYEVQADAVLALIQNGADRA